jgi:hypothetical protein
VGWLADLLLVDGDPSADVTVLGDKSRLREIILNGRRVDLPELPERRPVSGWRVSPYSSGALYWQDTREG